MASTVQRKPISLKLTGKIVDTDDVKATTAIKKIKELQRGGSLIKYVGQVGTVSSLQIQSFNTTYSNKNYGGADFDMTLQEIRIVGSSYVKSNASTTNAVANAKKTIEVGDKVNFKGGNVYVSSDAKKAASKRGASVCKVTKINTRSWALHKYHLVSTDSKWNSYNYVYGWVDASNVSAVASKTQNSSTGGTQQPKSSGSGNSGKGGSQGSGGSNNKSSGSSKSGSGTKSAKYHVVKNGDTVYSLVYDKYKSSNLSVKEVVAGNPNCFKNNSANSLIVGTRLCIKS